MSARDDLAKAQRGARTLGEIIEKQCRDVLEVTGLHHLINEDGDGHWDVVWMRLFEMRDELASLKESTIGRERLRGDKWRDRAQEMEVSRDAAIERVEAALEATKPRTITSVAQLEDLPFGSAVQTSDPSDVVVLRCEGSGFRNQSGAELSATDLWRYGTRPFTVIYEPAVTS